MKILGIDVSRDGVKIPFTHYRIPIPIFLSGLISLFGSPAVATNSSVTTGNYPPPDGSFQLYVGNELQYQRQGSCSHFSMQYFEHCFIERSNNLLQSTDFTTPLNEAELSCRLNDRTHQRSKDIIVLYDRSQDFSMRDVENCSVNSKDSFYSADPILKTFFCRAQLSCKTKEMGFQKRSDLTVLYRSRELMQSS